MLHVCYQSCIRLNKQWDHVRTCLCRVKDLALWSTVVLCTYVNLNVVHQSMCTCTHKSYVAGDHMSVIKPHVTCLMVVVSSARSLSIEYEFPSQAMLNSPFFAAACTRVHLTCLVVTLGIQQYKTDYSRNWVGDWSGIIVSAVADSGQLDFSKRIVASTAAHRQICKQVCRAVLLHTLGMIFQLAGTFPT